MCNGMEKVVVCRRIEEVVVCLEVDGVAPYQDVRPDSNGFFEA